MPISRQHLTYKALMALEEAANATSEAPVARSAALRFTLAYLFAQTDGKNRNWFDSFWQTVTDAAGIEAKSNGAGIGRSANATATLNAIYRLVGVERTPEIMYRAARKRRPQEDGS